MTALSRKWFGPHADYDEALCRESAVAHRLAVASSPIAADLEAEARP